MVTLKIIHATKDPSHLNQSKINKSWFMAKCRDKLRAIRFPNLECLQDSKPFQQNICLGIRQSISIDHFDFGRSVKIPRYSRFQPGMLDVTFLEQS